MKKRILLTGGSGFCGRNILEILGGKYNFFSPSHKKLNLLDSEQVRKYFIANGPFDFVMHAAIVGGNRKTGDSSDFALSNLRMFYNLVQNAKSFKKFIYLGSGIEYGKEKPIISASENDFGLRVPQSNFGLYKFICANFVEGSENLINMRIFGIFGQYEDYSIRFISNAICKSIFNMPITINQNVVFDYLYVKDFVRILGFFLNKNLKHKTYNITSGRKIDLVTIVKKINRISGKNLPIVIAKKGLSNEYTGSNRRLLLEIGDFQFTEIDKAVAELYYWYLERKKFLNKNYLLDDYF